MSYKSKRTEVCDVSVNGFPSVRAISVQTCKIEKTYINKSSMNAAHQAFASSLRRSPSNTNLKSYKNPPNRKFPKALPKDSANLRSPSLIKCMEHKHISIKHHEKITTLRDSTSQLQSPSLIKNITRHNTFDNNTKNKRTSIQRNLIDLQGKSYKNDNNSFQSPLNKKDKLLTTTEIQSSTKPIKTTKPMKANKTNKHKLRTYENAITIPQNGIRKQTKQIFSKEANSLTPTPMEVIEEPIVKKHFYLLGPTDHRTSH